MRVYLIVMILLLAPFAAYSESFTIEALKVHLEHEIEKKLGSKNISINDLIIKREGSGKIFTLKQAESANIADSLKISSVSVTGHKFTSTVSEVSGKFSLEVSGKVLKSVKIPVLSDNISKETEITQDLIELVDVTERSLRGTTITGIKELLGTVASRNLTKGAQIGFSDIKKPSVVKKNDVVQAIYQLKNMEIRTLAIAQSDGGINDVITLKNFDSGKVFEGRVGSDGKVSVNFEEREIVLGAAN